MNSNHRDNRFRDVSHQALIAENRATNIVTAAYRTVCLLCIQLSISVPDAGSVNQYDLSVLASLVHERKI